MEVTRIGIDAAKNLFSPGGDGRWRQSEVAQSGKKLHLMWRFSTQISRNRSVLSRPLSGFASPSTPKRCCTQKDKDHESYPVRFHLRVLQTTSTTRY
jgi:hypothetical protein